MLNYITDDIDKMVKHEKFNSIQIMAQVIGYDNVGDGWDKIMKFNTSTRCVCVYIHIECEVYCHFWVVKTWNGGPGNDCGADKDDFTK